MMGIMSALRAALLVLTAIVLTPLVAMALDGSYLLPVYAQRFDFRAGQWIGERLADPAPPGETCVVLGASTAREGFSMRALETAAPGTHFVSMATSGGAMEVPELQAQAIARYERHYRCIILAVNPWMLRTKLRPNIVSTEYIALLRPQDLLSIRSSYWREKETEAAFWALYLPLKKHAPQLNRLARYHLFRAREQLGLTGLDRSDFENSANELRPQGRFYNPRLALMVQRGRDRMRAQIQSSGLFDPSIYNSEEPSASFAHTLELAQAHADHVIVVTLPNPDIWDPATALVWRRYQTVLQNHAARVAVIDCLHGLKDDEFIDHGHPNGKGRSALTVSVGSILPGLFEGSADIVSRRPDVCQLAHRA